MNTTRPSGHRPVASARPSRAWAGFLACCLMLLGLSVGPMSQAAVGNPFLIDGDVPDSQTGYVNDPDGSTPELGPVNSSTTKLGVIHTAPLPMLGLTNPNAQVDLREVWVTSQTDDAGDVWLYFAWHRDSNKGSGVLMYEFQTNPAPAECDYTASDASLIEGCNPWANRQPGDFIIVWDQSGNAANIILRTWGYMSDGSFVTDPSLWNGEPLVLDAGVDLDANQDAFAAYSGNRFMGEAAVNLSNTVFPEEPTSCRTIANIIPGTVTGNSDTADYKDTVLGDFVDISNCGSVTITKDTDPEGGTGEFQYTLSRTDGSQIRFDGSTSAQYTLTEDGASNTEANLVAGSGYTLDETILSGPYDLVSIICDGKDMEAGETFDVVANTTKQCLITNEEQQGTLTVTKVVTHDDGGALGVTDFSFSIDGGTAVPFDADGSVSTIVDAGTYAVTEPEADTRGYSTSYSDTGGGDCSAVVVPAGGSATCTITNDDQPGTLTVTKVVTNDDGGTLGFTDFSFSIDGGTAVPFDADGSVSTTVDAGTYAVTEPEADTRGYTTSYSDGTADSCAAVVVPLGGSATCTITNDDQPGTLIVTKELVQDNGRTETVEDFSYTVDGGASVAFEPDGINSHTVDAGTYDVVEDEAAGYTTTYSDSTGGECMDIVIPNGGTETCTITNDDTKAEPAGTTVQSWILHDDLTITGLRAGGDPEDAATVTFRLYSDASCETQVGDDEVVALSGTTAGTSVGVTVTQSGDYYWRASYSGDQFNDAFTTGCGDEITDIRALDAYEGGRNDFE